QVDFILRLRRQEATLTPEDLALLQQTWREVLEEILGLWPITHVERKKWNQAIDLLLTLRRQARIEKHFALADFIRDRLQDMGVRLLDFPDETLWEWNE
ncbi:MAG: hypothetical protein D6750_03215, partial [Bacteroidetes bacterium]